MKIKKFNESTSRQIEWLDGDIFKLEDLTGKVTSFSKDRYFIHFENGAIGTELFYHQGQIDHCLNKEFKLIKLDHEDIFDDNTSHLGQASDSNYYVFILKSIQPNDYQIPSANSDYYRFIGIFDRAGILLFLITAISDDTKKMWLFDDILLIQTTPSYMFRINLNTKKYSLDSSTNFRKIVSEADKKN